MKKLANPFLKVGKTFGKFAKYTALAAAGAASVAAVETLPQYTDVLAGLLPPPLGTILALVLPSLLVGAAGAAKNFQKHRTITPEDLAALIAALETHKEATSKYLTRESIELLLRRAAVLAKK
jgi:hypothetical protein